MKCKLQMYDNRRWLAGFLLENFMSMEQSYNYEFRVIPGYKRLKSSGRLDGNENSLFSQLKVHTRVPWTQF